MVCLTGRFSAVNLLVVYVLSGFCSGVKQELCASWQIQAKGEVVEAVSRAVTAGIDQEAAS